MSSIEDVASFTPGFVGAEAGSIAGVFFIRGVGTGGSSTFAEQGVSINVDGVQSSTGQIIKMAQFDLEQVDVLRGPQALFFGKNSPGGVLAFRTADPGETFESQISLAYESEARERVVDGFISGPISDSLGARLAFSYTEMDGYMDIVTRDVPGVAIPASEDRYPKLDQLFLRGTLLFQPSDTFDARLKLNYSRRDSNGGPAPRFQRFDCPLGAPQAIVQVPECSANDKVVAGDTPVDALAAFPLVDPSEPFGFDESDQVLIGLEANWQLGAYTLTSITGFIQLDDDWQGEFGMEPVSKLVTRNPLELDRLSQELRLTSNLDGDWNWMVGVYYEDTEHFHQFTAGVVPFLFHIGQDDVTQDGKTLSAFAQVEYQVTDRFGFSGGLRYTHEEKEVDLLFGQNSVVVGGAHEKLDFDNVSPELTVTYDFDTDAMLFLSYREGFKSGGFDNSLGRGPAAAAGFSIAYDEETISGFEAGMKATFLDGTFQLNAIVFDYDYEDQQLASFDPRTLSLQVQNVAESSIRGVEMDAIWLPARVEGLTIRAAFAYLDSEYEDYISDCYTGQTIALGCNLNFNAATGRFTQQDQSGQQSLQAPEYSGSVGFVYERSLNALGGSTLSFASDLVYQDEYQSNQSGNPRAMTDSTAKVNASIRVASDKWVVELIGRNLTDEYDWVAGTTTPFTGTTVGGTDDIPADLIGFVTRGREVMLKATYRFD